MSHYAATTHVSRRYPHQSPRYTASNGPYYSASSSSPYNNPNEDKILWNTWDPSKLLNSIPSISSYAPNFDNGFVQHLNYMKKLITWLENESDIFDNSLLNESKFNRIKTQIDAVTNCVSNGLNECHELIEGNKVTYHNYSKYKARLTNIRNQYESINKELNHSMYKLSRQFKQKKAKKSLLENANKTGYAQADEYQHLKSSLSIVDETLQMIADVKTDMMHQSQLLKGVKSQLLKFLNLTGFSGSIIRVISQRSTMDFYIFIFGCILTLTIIFALWWYF